MVAVSVIDLMSAISLKQKIKHTSLAPASFRYAHNAVVLSFADGGSFSSQKRVQLVSKCFLFLFFLADVQSKIQNFRLRTRIFHVKDSTETTTIQKSFVFR